MAQDSLGDLGVEEGVLELVQLAFKVVEDLEAFVRVPEVVDRHETLDRRRQVHQDAARRNKGDERFAGIRLLRVGQLTDPLSINQPCSELGIYFK